jgi:hypothetical protein
MWTMIISSREVFTLKLVAESSFETLVILPHHYTASKPTKARKWIINVKPSVVPVSLNVVSEHLCGNIFYEQETFVNVFL